MRYCQGLLKPIGFVRRPRKSPRPAVNPLRQCTRRGRTRCLLSALARLRNSAPWRRSCAPSTPVTLQAKTLLSTAAHIPERCNHLDFERRSQKNGVPKEALRDAKNFEIPLPSVYRGCSAMGVLEQTLDLPFLIEADLLG